MNQLPLIVDGLPQPCSGCIANAACPAIGTTAQCPVKWPSKGAGTEELGPCRPDAAALYDAIGGFALEQNLQNVRSPGLTAGLLPTIRVESQFGTSISAPLVVVRISEVFRSGRILSADEIRSICGLSTSTDLLISWIENDKQIEVLDRHLPTICEGIATGNFAGVMAPPYPTYRNRTYFNARFNIVRSVNDAVELSHSTTKVIPVIAPCIEADVKDLARLLNCYPDISLVAVDAGRGLKAGNHRTVELVAEFDRLTGEHFHYFFHGAASRANYQFVMSSLSPDRVTFSNFRAAYGWTKGFRGSASEMFTALHYQQQLHYLAARRKAIGLQSGTSPSSAHEVSAA